MIGIILCAGFATRMYPLTRDFPKPLLPVAGKPVIDYLMDRLTEIPELNVIHIVTNDRFIHHFENWQKTWSDRNQVNQIRTFLHNDGADDNENRLGALSDLQFVLGRIKGSSQLLVSAGDNIFQFSFKPIWQEFSKRDWHYVVALPEKDPYKLKRTGILELDADNRVLDFHEKPADPPSNWSCPALYFFQPTVKYLLDSFLESNQHKDAPGHFVKYLCRKENVYAFKPDGFRLDIGDMKTYRQADTLMRHNI